jgi:hypothetical protein
VSDNNERVANEQNNIPGQQKDVNVKDYPSAIELANILKMSITLQTKIQ